MTTSSSLDMSGTGRRSLAIFTRFSAVFVGLVNLALLAALNSVDSAAIQRGNVEWGRALPVVLAALIAGLLTSEIVLRLLKRPALSEKFFDRYAIGVFAICLGETLMGGLFAAMLGLDGALAGRSVVVPEVILAASATGVMGVGVGGGLGLAEGLILAAPLAAILGLFRNAAG